MEILRPAIESENLKKRREAVDTGGDVVPAMRPRFPRTVIEFFVLRSPKSEMTHTPTAVRVDESDLR